MRQDPRALAAESIESAIAELSSALAELARIPVYDRATVGWVAHAINNYLSVSDATIGLIDAALDRQQSPELARWLDGLRRLGSLMHHTVGRLLRASAPADFPLKPSYVNLPLLMQRACDAYRSAAARKHLQIVCGHVGEVPPAWADPVGVAVVADNLLSNAVKFSPPGGEIIVQVLAGPGGVVCTVRDFGAGLTSAELKRLFRAGTAVGPRPTAGEPSSGFGLAIAREFAERMGGKLWAESQPGQGACFSLRLPYHPEPSAEPPRLPEADSAVGDTSD